MMDDIRLLLVKTFGIALSDEEVNDVLKWYTENSITSEEDLRKKLTKYLFEKYKGRTLMFFEEDTSNLQYLLKLIKDKTKGN